MNNNLIITGARIITPIGRKARKGKEMDQLFDENGNSLDNTLVKANDVLEDILIAEFDMDRIRAYREQETWGNAYRKPAAYRDLVDFEVKKPFIRNS